MLTQEGIPLFGSQEYRQRFKDKMSKSLRFVQKVRDEPGPGEYWPANELADRVKAMHCFKIKKPELKDEHLYEIINGHQKVFVPENLSPGLQKKFYKRARQLYGHPDRGCATQIH